MNTEITRTLNIAPDSDSLFNRTLRECHTGIDTCTWLLDPEDRQQLFFRNLEIAQQETGCPVWTTEETIGELRSKLDDPDLSAAAARALDYLSGMQRENRIIIYQQSPASTGRRPFADPVFLARLLENRDIPVALITQDRALACDVMQLNDFRSVRGCRIMVYRANGAGRLARFTLLKDGEGKYVDPRSTGLFVTQGTPASAADNTPVPMADLNPGDVVWGTHGATHRLGEEWEQGAESSIFAVEGSPDRLVKIFRQPSRRKAEKCRLLQESSFPCSGAALPLDLVYDQQGSFRGYTMKRIHGVELSVLLTPSGRKQVAPSWNRLSYVTLAYRLAQLIFDFSLGGILIADISPANFLVGYNDSGILDPDNLFAVDLDSAQFGSDRLGCVYPPDGLTPDYAAPEFLRGSLDEGQLRAPSSVLYSASLLCLQCCLCGVHPFLQGMENGRTTPVAQAIAGSAFPYSSRGDYRQATAPAGADKLWSNMSADAKQFFHHLFQQGGKYNAVADRPSLVTLPKVLRSYLTWISRPENQIRYPEILSLEPSRLKPFYARCACRDCKHPDEEFVVTTYRSDSRYYCPECLARIRSGRAVGPAVPPLGPAPTRVAFPGVRQPSVLPDRDALPRIAAVASAAPQITAAPAPSVVPAPRIAVSAPAAPSARSTRPDSSLLSRFSGGIRKIRDWLIA